MIHKINKQEILASGKDHLVLDPSSKLKMVAGDLVELPNGGFQLITNVRPHYWYSTSQNYQQATYFYTRSVKKIKSASMIKNKDKSKTILETSKKESYSDGDLVYSFGSVWKVKKIMSQHAYDQQLHVKKLD
jgi:hypothetical protein